MDALFSCRNCIHNCAQSLNVGPGPGFCLQHNSVILKPEDTTCKYLHRKDLPRFVVDEGIREHAVEFALFSGMASLSTRQPIENTRYSERFVWERHLFDPLTHAIAQYHKTQPAWVFIQAFTGGLDGRRSLAHAAFVRRYMDHCGTWKSSYRLVLAVIQEIDEQPSFDHRSIVLDDSSDPAEVIEDALWDVVFVRLAAVQEYGWHSGLKELMWATDLLNGSLTDLDWPRVRADLAGFRDVWTNQVIEHATAEKVFFPAADSDSPDAE